MCTRVGGCTASAVTKTHAALRGQRQGHVSRAVLSTTQQPMIPCPSQTSAPLGHYRPPMDLFLSLQRAGLHTVLSLSSLSLNTQFNSIAASPIFCSCRPRTRSHHHRAPLPNHHATELYMRQHGCSALQGPPMTHNPAWHPHGKLDVQLSRSGCRGAVIILAVAAATSRCRATVGIRAMRPCLCVAATTACARVSLRARHARVPMLALWCDAGRAKICGVVATK